MAILSRRLILLAISLYEQFIHYTQPNLSPNIQCLSTQQCAYQSFSSYFLVRFLLRRCDTLETVNLNMNYSALTTMYERDIRSHTVVTSHGAGMVTYHEKKQKL